MELNKKVIIRAKDAGVFFGTITRKEGDEVQLADCRRLWYWDGACSISELAVNGTASPSNCKFSVVVPEITILGVCEIIPCTEKAITSIENVPLWKRA